MRLKGGDPFVFGRGGEEAEALAAAGVRFEVVPGVTAGVAAPAYAGIPVTHRDAASAVAFVTGHEDPGKPDAALDWEALARFPGTLVFYMGIRNLPLIAERLTAAGRDPGEAVAVVERGTHPGQRTIVDTLGGIAARVEAEEVRPPAITLVGPVAELRDTIAWVERRPLHGEVVAVTRARAQASGLAARLRELGAEVVETPAIRIQPRPVEAELREAIERIEEYSLVCLTSPNGVRLLFEGLGEAGRDARALAGATVAAIGPGTAAELARRGIHADVVPERFVAEALVEALEGVPVEGRRVLVARAAEAREVLPEALRARGAEVDDVALYETVAEPLTEGERAGLERATYVTFTSSSTVRFLVESGARPRPERADRLDRPGHLGHRRGARPDGGRRGGAARHRRACRRSHRRRDAATGSRVIVTLLTDYGRDDDFVGRVPRRHPPDPPRGRDRGHHARDRALRGEPGRARPPQHAAVHAERGCTWRWSTRRWAPSGARSRCGPATAASWSARTTGC